jgi:hypothetical protein
MNDSEKQIIANKIKCISEADVKNDYKMLKNLAGVAVEFNERCRVGNNVVDFFTFRERLETRGKYNINFYDFFTNIEEFKKKKFIQTMLTYYETTKNARGLKNECIVLKEVYNICISAINIFRPLLSIEVYQRFKPTRILDFSAGWGGRAVGAAACGISYFGLDINAGLHEAYNKMSDFLNSSSSFSSSKKLIIRRLRQGMTWYLRHPPIILSKNTVTMKATRQKMKWTKNFTFPYFQILINTCCLEDISY